MNTVFGRRGVRSTIQLFNLKGMCMSEAAKAIRSGEGSSEDSHQQDSTGIRVGTPGTGPTSSLEDVVSVDFGDVKKELDTNKE